MEKYFAYFNHYYKPMVTKAVSNKLFDIEHMHTKAWSVNKFSMKFNFLWTIQCFACISYLWMWVYIIFFNFMKWENIYFIGVLSPASKNKSYALVYTCILIELFHDLPLDASCQFGRDRIVVSTSRCGRDNPGSNPGHGKAAFHLLQIQNLIKRMFFKFSFTETNVICIFKDFSQI